MIFLGSALILPKPSIFLFIPDVKPSLFNHCSIKTSTFCVVLILITLDSVVHHAIVSQEGFYFFRNDRIVKEGNSVAFYILEAWKVKILTSSDPKYDNTPEYIIAEIKKGNSAILIAVVYRRPGPSSLIDFFDTLSNFTANYHHIIITGDFNADLLNPTKSNTKILCNLVNNHAFSVVLTLSIYHLLHLDPLSHTTLDLFIVNHAESVIDFTKSESSCIADH